MRRVILVSLLTCVAAAAQAPSFEIASIREHKGEFPKLGITTSGPRLTAMAWVGDLIRYAYDLKDYELIGESSSNIFDTIYEVMAKAEGSTEPSIEQFRQMIQQLLEDRFKFKFHRESVKCRSMHWS